MHASGFMVLPTSLNFLATLHISEYLHQLHRRTDCDGMWVYLVAFLPIAMIYSNFHNVSADFVTNFYTQILSRFFSLTQHLFQWIRKCKYLSSYMQTMFRYLDRASKLWRLRPLTQEKPNWLCLSLTITALHYWFWILSIGIFRGFSIFISNLAVRSKTGKKVISPWGNYICT